MRKLIAADLHRLWLNKAFWFSVLCMLGMDSFCCILLLTQHTTRIDIGMYIMILGIGVITSVFLSLYLGTEYSDGTIRNKLIVGHTRRDVYLASLLTAGVAITILYVGWGLIGGIFALISSISLYTIAGQIVLSGVMGWLACIAYSTIFHMIGMLSTNKARTSIICILTAFLLMFLGLLCYSFARPGLFVGLKQRIFQFLFDFNPFGQIFQVMSIDVASFWKLSTYSLLLSIALAGIGMYCFYKKDLK